MAYQAEIKVGVRGLKRVQELQSALNKVNIKINAINKVESAKASAGQKQKLTSVEKNLKVETQAAQIQKRALAIKDNILKMDMKGVKVSQVKAKLTRAINQAEKGKFINAKRNIAVAEKELQILKAQTVERGKQGKNTFQFPMGKSSPLRFSDQGQLLPGSSRRFDRQSALISGGFPLLFGQGPLTAAAGALGGGFGGMLGGQMGGFAGGIAATAAVQSIQNVINGIGELGTAMNRLNPNISAMSQAMGIAGTVEEKRLQLIEKNLGKQAAFNAALEMMGDKIGADRAEELRKFGETFQELGNKVTLFFTKVQAAIAKLLNKALDAGADANLRGRARDLIAKNPNNAAFRDINREIANLEARPSSTFGRGKSGAKRKRDQINALKSERLVIAETLILEKDKDKLRAKTNGLITAGLSGLKKEDDLNRAIIAGKEEEFLVQQAIKDKAEEMGLVFKDLESGQQQRIKDGVLVNRDLKEQAKNAKAVKDAFESISQSIGTDIKDGIKGLIKGTSTLGDLLNNVADRFLDVALNQALFGDVLGAGGKKGGGILGFLTGGLLANGGRAAGGKSFIVGEKGPELFVPKSSGTVVPNDKLGGGGNTSVVVNVDASGTDVQGDEAEAKELGTLISIAIQGELLKQQRPGGLLSNTR